MAMNDERRVGRPLEFAPEAVVEAAMGLFWSRGYESTSLEDLEAGSRLGRSSLYNAFGSKQALYLRAVRHYLERLGEYMFAPLEHGRGGLADVEAFLARLSRGLSSGMRVPGRPRGCLVINGMVEFGGRNRAFSAASRDFTARFERAMGAALRRAAKRGEISSREVAGKGRLLMAIAMGIHVAARAGAPQAQVRAVALDARRQVRAWRRESAPRRRAAATSSS